MSYRKLIGSYLRRFNCIPSPTAYDFPFPQNMMFARDTVTTVPFYILSMVHNDPSAYVCTYIDCISTKHLRHYRLYKLEELWIIQFWIILVRIFQTQMAIKRPLKWTNKKRQSVDSSAAEYYRISTLLSTNGNKKSDQMLMGRATASV